MSNPEQPMTLEEFVADTGDRDRSEIFAGRADELGWLRKQVATMRGMCERSGRVQGSVRAVTGCPGIGKTALLRRFADECRADHLVVEATLDDMTSVGALTACVADSGRSQYGAALDRLPNIGHLRDIAGFVRAAVELAAPPKGVVLLLDEAQQVTEGRHGSVIHFLHTGSQGQPVFPIFFGLDDTRDSLERAGASRIPPENRIGLRVMDGIDSAAVLRNFERAFNVRPPPDLAGRLLADSQGFPQHLNSALRSLGEEWLRAGGRADGLDAEAVLDKARARREAYYDDRFKPLSNDPRAAVMVDLTNRRELSVSQLHAAATQAYRNGGYAAKEAEDSAKALISSMLRRGAVSEDADGICRTPIPSFLTWLREKYPAQGTGGLAGGGLPR